MIRKMQFNSIRFQWIGFSILISIIPLIILQLIYFTISKNRIIKIAEEGAEQKAQQIQFIADKKIEDEKEGLLVLYDFLKAQPSVSSLDSFKFYIAKYFFTYRNIYSRISILNPEGKQQVSFISNYNPDYLYEQKWEQRIDLKGLPIETVEGLSERVTSIGFYPSVYGYAERLILSMGELGLILADLRLKAVFKDALKQANVLPMDDVFVHDNNGTVLWATAPEWNNQRVETVSGDIKSRDTKTNGGPFVVSSSTTKSPLSVGLLMHYGSLLDPLQQTLYIGLWLTLSFASIISLVIWFLTRKLKQSIVPLIKGTEEIAMGNLDYRISNTYFRELNVLSNHFNDMTARLNSVIKEMAQKEQMVMLGEFSSFVIHDLKSPLSAMELLAENLDEEIQELPLAKNLSKYTRDLSIGIQKLEEFVEKILDFARPIELNAVKTDLNHFLEQVIKEIPTPVELYLDNTELMVSVDEVQFKRVIFNIVTNADEAIQSRDDGEIIIQTFLQDSKVCIDIRDNGIGIPAEDIPQVFHLFYTTKSRVGGHGLGLTIVKRIVEAHNGNIKIQSKLGEGTTFSIQLPISHEERENTQRKEKKNEG